MSKEDFGKGKQAVDDVLRRAMVARRRNVATVNYAELAGQRVGKGRGSEESPLLSAGAAAESDRPESEEEGADVFHSQENRGHMDGSEELRPGQGTKGSSEQRSAQIEEARLARTQQEAGRLIEIFQSNEREHAALAADTAEEGLSGAAPGSIDPENSLAVHADDLAHNQEAQDVQWAREEFERRREAALQLKRAQEFMEQQELARKEQERNLRRMKELDRLMAEEEQRQTAKIDQERRASGRRSPGKQGLSLRDGAAARQDGGDQKKAQQDDFLLASDERQSEERLHRKEGFVSGMDTTPYTRLPSSMLTLDNFHESLRWAELVDELRTEDTSSLDGFNHMVWTRRTAQKALMSSNSCQVIVDALKEDPMMETTAEQPSRRQRVLEEAASWLLINKAKGDPDMWKHARVKTPKDGVPSYLEHRTMQIPEDCTAYYRVISGRWGARPREEQRISQTISSGRGSPKRPGTMVRMPPSPSEGASGRRCANCGSESRRHPDLWSCVEPRVDFVRSVAELQLLAQFDAVRRSARNLRGRTENTDSSESVGDEDSYSEDEEEEEYDPEEEETFSSSLSATRSWDNSSLSNAGKEKESKKKKSRSLEAVKEDIQGLSEDVRQLVQLVKHQADQQEAHAQQLRAISGLGAVRHTQRSPVTLQDQGNLHRGDGTGRSPAQHDQRDGGAHQGGGVALPRPFVASGGASASVWPGSKLGQSPARGTLSLSSNAGSGATAHPFIGSGSFNNPMHNTTSLRPAGTRTAADLPGMDGCPEIKPRDLLCIKALEIITRKYDEYADLAVARDRDPKPFTAVFVKHSTELAMKFNNLIKMRNSLAIQLCEEESYSGDAVLQLSNSNFKALYNEICIGGVKTPSQALAILEATTFERLVKREDGNEHDALVMRGAAAFREKLDTLPMEVLRMCNNQLIKKAFVGMMLGRQSANLADYSTCDTWTDCVQHMFYISSTDQSEYFVKRARAVVQNGALTGQDEESDPDDWSKPRSKGRRGLFQSGRQWETRADNPEEDIRLYKAEFMEMRGRVKHREEDLAECHTFWKRVKKLRYLESIQGGGGGAAEKGDGKSSQQSFPSTKASRPTSEGGRGARVQSSQRDRSAEEVPSRAQVPPSTEDMPVRTLVCYNCQEEGHMARDCSKPQRERPRGASPRPSSGGGGGASARP
jgi:hypothetical protein